jgi:hypothetical protein
MCIDLVDEEIIGWGDPGLLQVMAHAMMSMEESIDSGSNH